MIDPIRQRVAELEEFLLNTSSPIFGCSHVCTGTLLPFMCLNHPSAGVLCGECLATHTQRADTQRLCDRCQLEPMLSQGRLYWFAVENLVLERPDGSKTGIASGEIGTFVGLCDTCTGQTAVQS